MSRFPLPAQLRLVFLLLSPCLAIAAPSFDCRRATHEIEKLVCSDAKLSALDQQMAELFSRAMQQAKPAEKPELLAEQRGWIKNRNGCARRTEPRKNCVAEHYSQRNSRLEELLAAGSGNAAPPDAAPRSTRLQCDDGVPITAVYTTGSAASVQITRGDRVWVLPAAVAGSGARYAQDGIVFWTKGREAQFEQGERASVCRESP